MSPRVAVIGAGMGGLAAAALLSARGAEVVVLERADAPGGKLRRVEVGGRAIDVGPTVLTLRPVFEQLFSDCGGDLASLLTLERAEVLARHHWPDGSTLDLHADVERSAEAVAAFAGAKSAASFRAFLARARETFETLDHSFMRDPSPSLPGLLLKAGPGRLSRIDPYQTYAKALEGQFEDRRLRQLFGRYATYVGSSPFEAPATLMLIAHVEQAGVWRVEGGLWRLAKALEARACAAGARFRYRSEVAAVLEARGRVSGVRLADGEVIAADAVVHDGDPGVLASGRLGRAAARGLGPIQASERSFSALTLALVAEVEGPLLHHTVLFSPDSRSEFADLEAGRMPRDPSLYVCAQDRGDRAEGLGGAERLFMILNAPARGEADYPDRAEVERCETRIRARLEEAGVSLSRMERQVIGPQAFEAREPGTGGALYGRSAKGWMAAFKRPGARARLPGLYLAGGGVHPGPGLPMAALSGRAAADCLLADWTARSGAGG